MSVARALLVIAALLLSGPALALIETYEFSKPELEVRYQQLSEELRCPKCQNQNIADSNAPIAQDLRKLLHQQLELGASDAEILEYMVARYGEFVRYRPRFGGTTMVLWLAPVILLVLGGSMLLVMLRTRASTRGAEAASLSPEERLRLRSLLEQKERDS